MRARRVLGLPLLTLVSLGACGLDLDLDLERRLGTALQSTVTAVQIDDAEVKASCRGGGQAVVPVSALQLDWLGLSSVEHQAKVAEALHQQCAALLRVRAESEQAAAQVRERAQQLGLSTADASVEELRTRICDAFRAQLPSDPAARAIVIEDHLRSYGCAAVADEAPAPPPPPPPPLIDVPPSGAWTWREESGRVPRVRFSLAAAEEEGRSSYGLQLVCTARSAALLTLSTTRKLRRGRPVLELDGEKTRIRGKVGRGSRTVVFSDGARALPLLLEATELQVSLPMVPAGKARFVLTGLREAIAPYRNLCGLSENTVTTMP
ncbi:MAG: hypothetical protein ACO3JL_16190 [Myxococcota bacterium]